MSWSIALFFIAAVLAAAWWGRVQLRYFGGIKRRFTTEFDARRRLATEVSPSSTTNLTSITVMLPPSLVEAVDRFIAAADESRRLDRPEAIKLLMTEALAGLDFLPTNDSTKTLGEERHR